MCKFQMNRAKYNQVIRQNFVLQELSLLVLVVTFILKDWLLPRCLCQLLKSIPNATCAPNEDSNQPAHPRSPIRVFVVCMKTLHPFAIQNAPSEGSDQTMRWRGYKLENMRKPWVKPRWARSLRNKIRYNPSRLNLRLSHLRPDPLSCKKPISLRLNGKSQRSTIAFQTETSLWPIEVGIKPNGRA